MASTLHESSQSLRIVGIQSRSALFAGVTVTAIGLLSVAIWNGFPLTFYDTGGYLAIGLGSQHAIGRSYVYSLFLLLTGGRISLWFPIICQAFMTAFLVVEVIRVELPRLPITGYLIIAAILSGLTGIGWYVGEIEPDCLAALVVLGSYIVLFGASKLSRVERLTVIGITSVSAASHPSHFGLITGLMILSLAARGLARLRGSVFRPNLRYALLCPLLALALILISNFALTHRVFLFRSGPGFIFGRLVQDGIVNRLLDDTCPGSGYKLCAYKDRLPTSADAWLWTPSSPFYAEGGFAGSEKDDWKMIFDSIRRYPLMHIEAAIRDSITQFFRFRTGDGIDSQEWLLRPVFKRLLPRQLPAYESANQQRESIDFRAINIIHVTVGVLSLLGSAALLYGAISQGRWTDTALPGIVLAALIGNAIICGTFSNPHDRYQSRVIWLPTLVCLLALGKNSGSLQLSNNELGSDSV